LAGALKQRVKAPAQAEANRDIRVTGIGDPLRQAMPQCFAVFALTKRFLNAGLHRRVAALRPPPPEIRDRLVLRAGLARRLLIENCRVSDYLLSSRAGRTFKKAVSVMIS
jgi:hypothetical protein